MRIHYILEISPLFWRFVQTISIFLNLSKLCSNLMISEQKMSFSPFFSKNMDSTGLPKWFFSKIEHTEFFSEKNPILKKNDDSAT